MTKSISQNTEQYPASEAAPTGNPGPWTEGDISFRKGNCNILLIAPHGYEEDDEKTYDITRLAANQLDCYAFVTKSYQKPPKKKDPITNEILIGSKGKPIRHDPDKKKKWINLNRKDQVHKYLKSEFEKPLLDSVKEIIKEYGKALVLWIHGIDDGNLTPDNTEGNIPGVDALIGVGQGNPEDRLTAEKETVDKLIAALQSNPVKSINAALAEKGSDYCGRHKNIMNQYFRFKEYIPDKVESIQIEIRKIGFREDDNSADTAMALANSFSGMTLRPPDESKQAILDSAVQSEAIQKIKINKIDFSDGQFMSRIDKIDADSVEFKRLVDSVEKDGVLINFIVRKRTGNDGKPYQLISGFRRMAALKASKNGKSGFEDQTVWARVLDAAISDEEAYRVSFTENLLRKDLSLWEIALACARIKEEKKADGKMDSGQIEAHLAGLIHKDPRTVRRYLKLASINDKDKDIKEAVHTGFITPTTALEMDKKDLLKDDSENICTLLNHLNTHPKTTREFENFYANIEYCNKVSGLTLTEVLRCKHSDDFLSLKKGELKNRIEHLRQKTKEDYKDIFQGKAGLLIKNCDQIDDGLKKRDDKKNFLEENKGIIDKVSEAFRNSNIMGKFKIEPALGSDDHQVTMTITVSKDQMWQAIDAVSMVNMAHDGEVIQKANPQAHASTDALPAPNINYKPSANPTDELKPLDR